MFLFFGPISYIGLAMAMNRYTVVASQSSLSASCGPIPFIRARRYAPCTLVQAYVAVGLQTSQSAMSYTMGIVHVIDKDSNSDPLCSAPSSNGAFQIVHELQEFYGWDDCEVFGHTTDPRHPGIRGPINKA